MSINSIHTNVRNNTVVESIKDIIITDGVAKVTVESIEFDGVMTIVDEFFAEVPVLVVK